MKQQSLENGQKKSRFHLGKQYK